MLFVPNSGPGFGKQVATWGTTRPNASTNGTSITPGTGGVKGSWTAIGSALTEDCFGIYVNIHSTTLGTGTSREVVLDIGVDPLGGTSYSVLIPNIPCGDISTYGLTGCWYYFPIYIRSGATLAARALSNNATAFRVGGITLGYPANLAGCRIGSFAENIGITEGNTAGVSITAGTTNDGSWTLIGSTAQKLWWWQFCVQINLADTTVNAAAIHCDLAVGDGTNFNMIFEDQILTTTTSEQQLLIHRQQNCIQHLPAGVSLYARMQSSGNSDGYNCAVIGIGG